MYMDDPLFLCGFKLLTGYITNALLLYSTAASKGLALQARE